MYLLDEKSPEITFLYFLYVWILRKNLRTKGRAFDRNYTMLAMDQVTPPHACMHGLASGWPCLSNAYLKKSMKLITLRRAISPLSGVNANKSVTSFCCRALCKWKRVECMQIFTHFQTCEKCKYSACIWQKSILRMAGPAHNRWAHCIHIQRPSWCKIGFKSRMLSTSKIKSWFCGTSLDV